MTTTRKQRPTLSTTTGSNHARIWGTELTTAANARHKTSRFENADPACPSSRRDRHGDLRSGR